MATVYLPDGGSYDDGNDDLLNRVDTSGGNRGTAAPTLSTMPVSSPSPSPSPTAGGFDYMSHLDKLSGFRKAAEGARQYEDQTDLNILTNPRFKTFALSGQYTPSGDMWPDAEQPGANFGGITEHRIVDTASNPRAAMDFQSPPFTPTPFQFNDPYTKQLEALAQRALESFTGQNQQTKQLMDFLNKQFSELSTSNGYSPEELAVLRTQALEPIEANRQASQRRVLERAGMRGILPSSGLVQDEHRTVDTDFDRMRTAADRDLAINSINQRKAKMQQALELAQLGMQVPQQQNAQALNVAQMLYQLPRQAMLDAQGVINGSAPQNMISPYIQLLQQQQQADLIKQQQDQQYWNTIGTQLAGLFG